MVGVSARQRVNPLTHNASMAMVRFHFPFVLSDEVGFEPDASWHALAYLGMGPVL